LPTDIWTHRSSRGSNISEEGSAAFRAAVTGSYGEGDLLYGGNRTTRRVKALTGACLLAGAFALGGAAAARAQTPTPTPIPDRNDPTAVAVTDHVTWLDNSRGTNGNMAAANFIDYGGDLGDFMF